MGSQEFRHCRIVKRLSRHPTHSLESGDLIIVFKFNKISGSIFLISTSIVRGQKKNKMKSKQNLVPLPSYPLEQITCDQEIQAFFRDLYDRTLPGRNSVRSRMSYS